MDYCEYCCSGIHSAEDLVVCECIACGHNCDTMTYHRWCFERVLDEKDDCIWDHLDD